MLRTSDTVKEINTALSSAQKSIGIAVKDTANPFFKSRYADLASVWLAIQEPLTNNGLAITQSPGVVVENGVTFVAVTTRLSHSSGEWMEGTCCVPTVKTDPQAFGSAIKYARRYALAAFTGVVDGDDDDAEKSMGRNVETPPKSEAPPAKKPVPKVTEPAKPGPKDSTPSGDPTQLQPQNKASLVALGKYLMGLGAKNVEHYDFLLSRCSDGVVANPTWAEFKEDSSINWREVKKSIENWQAANSHIPPHSVYDSLLSLEPTGAN